MATSASPTTVQLTLRLSPAFRELLEASIAGAGTAMGSGEGRDTGFGFGFTF